MWLCDLPNFYKFKVAKMIFSLFKSKDYLYLFLLCLFFTTGTCWKLFKALGLFAFKNQHICFMYTAVYKTNFLAHSVYFHVFSMYTASSCLSTTCILPQSCIFVFRNVYQCILQCISVHYCIQLLFGLPKKFSASFLRIKMRLTKWTSTQRNARNESQVNSNWFQAMNNHEYWKDYSFKLKHQNKHR